MNSPLPKKNKKKITDRVFRLIESFIDTGNMLVSKVNFENHYEYGIKRIGTRSSGY